MNIQSSIIVNLVGYLKRKNINNDDYEGMCSNPSASIFHVLLSAMK